MDAHSTPANTAHGPEHHEAALRLYFIIYGVLMVLLVLTVWVAYMKMGAWALPIALTIAVIKAVLVVIYFMHMRVTGKLMWLWFSVGIVWLGMMLFGILTDVVMRTR